ncbi:MAG TPA: ankyrin repeat domain-containing protein [Chitinophagaceae bacterium]|nr:ankyrin repeat domain-containing protein [Chitinophagaceae bacterium]
MANPGRPRKCDPRVESTFIDIEKQRNDKVKAILKETGIDAPDGNARTALIHAAAYNNIDLLKWLVDQGANLDHQDRNGYSALHFAGQNGLVEIARFLLEKGANPNLQDSHGNSPLWTAVFNSMDEKGVMQLLLKYGADTELRNKYDKSPKDLYLTIYSKDLQL